LRYPASTSGPARTVRLRAYTLLFKAQGAPSTKPRDEARPILHGAARHSIAGKVRQKPPPGANNGGARTPRRGGGINIGVRKTEPQWGLGRQVGFRVIGDFHSEGWFSYSAAKSLASIGKTGIQENGKGSAVRLDVSQKKLEDPSPFPSMGAFNE